MSLLLVPTEAKRRVQERKVEKRERRWEGNLHLPPIPNDLPTPRRVIPIMDMRPCECASWDRTLSPSLQTARVPMLLDEGHLGSCPRVVPPVSHGRPSHSSGFFLESPSLGGRGVWRDGLEPGHGLLGQLGPLTSSEEAR